MENIQVRQDQQKVAVRLAACLDNGEGMATTTLLTPTTARHLAVQLLEHAERIDGYQAFGPVARISVVKVEA